MPIAINGSGTITGISAGGLPDGVITTDDIAAAAVTQAKRSEQLTLATVQASTSGTSIDFTGIPSWVKRVTVMFSGVSTNGTSNPMVQIGTSAGVEATGYLGAAGFVGAATAAGNFTTGFGLSFGTAATSTFHGVALLTGMGSNLWAFGFSGGYSSGANSISAGGAKTLAGTLDRVRITTVNGTDTFDAGSINIMYE